MMEMTLLISILVFFSMVLFILGIYSYSEYRRGRKDFIRRVKQVGEGTAQGKAEERDISGNILKKKLLDGIHSLGVRVKPRNDDELSDLRKSFLKAGYRGEKAPVIFWGLKAFLALLFPAIFFLAKLFLPFTILPAHFLFCLVLLALLGFYFPNLWLRFKIEKRKERILKGFPDALDLMVVCVEAGMGLDAAINRVGEEMKLSNEAVSEEFRLLSLELRAGKMRRDALRNLALRTDLEDVNSLVTLLIQTDKFGTSVAQALRVQSDSMRTKRRQRAEEEAAKLPIKLIFPVILFIFPALFVAILGPAVISLVRIFFPVMKGN